MQEIPQPVVVVPGLTLEYVEHGQKQQVAITTQEQLQEWTKPTDPRPRRWYIVEDDGVVAAPLASDPVVFDDEVAEAENEAAALEENAEADAELEQENEVGEDERAD